VCAPSMYAAVEPTSIHTGGGKATSIVASSHGAGTGGDPLSKEFSGLNVSYFDATKTFPNTLISYQSNSKGIGVGKSLLWALAHELEKHDVDTFNGYQVTGGANWMVEFFSMIPECKVLVAMFSKSYFESEACIKELIGALMQGKPVIPIFLEEVNMVGHFLGEEVQQIKNANFINTQVVGNCIPPPDQGFFPGKGTVDFKRNAKTLADTIKKNFLK